jgi:hypothetical protein
MKTMNKLKKQGAKSSLSGLIKNQDCTEQSKKTRLTTVRQSTATTYKVAPLTMRLSLNDKQAVGDWVNELQDSTHRRVSAAKLMRALLAIKDDIDQDELLKNINEM